MKKFVGKYADQIHRVLSCFDRMLFRGYLPIMSGWAIAEFLNSLDLSFNNLKHKCLAISIDAKKAEADGISVKVWDFLFTRRLVSW